MYSPTSQPLADAAQQAQAVPLAPPPPTGSSSQWLIVPTQWPGQGDLLQWCQDMSPGAATLLILAGMVYLAFGWHIFKALITLNAALVGAYLGALLGQRGGSAIGGACVGAFVTAAVAFPLMKYSVALMGGAFGALLGASIWRTVGLEPHLAWAGALSGLIAFGLLSFIIYRGSIIMYTSLQGSVMLIFGLLGLIYKYQSVAPKVTEAITLKPFMLPMLIFIPALLGLIYQQTHFPPPPPEPKKK